MSFPQLYTTTAYSLQKSTLQLAEYVEHARRLGYDTIAITDQNVLYGAVEFFQYCQKYQLNAVIGMELCYQTEQNERAQVLLYAKDLTGYQNLMQLSTIAMTQAEPVRLSAVKQWLSHLAAVLPLENEVTALLDTQKESALHALAHLKELLEELYIERSRHSERFPEIYHFMTEQKVPEIALAQAHYLTAEDRFAVEVLQHIHAGTQLSFQELKEPKEPGEEYLRPQEENAVWFAERYAAALENAQTLAASCCLKLPLHQKLLPHFPLPEESEPAAYLRKLCEKRLPQRVTDPDARYYERLEKELAIIHSMGFDDYFLIVWDVMDFAHREKIVTGAGRGSAAGSLVSYVLAITDVDPIRYNLLFERFLNPERMSMPDIDLDIPDNRRDEVLRYVHEKYGHYHMSQIATFGTMAAKMVLRDVGRVFGLSQSEMNRWSKAVPSALKVTLEQAVNESGKLVQLIQQDELSRLLFETAQKLEGLPRHVSTHAAGVVISDQDLRELVPLQTGSEDILLTQFTMNAVEGVGLLKMDFLGLRNLSIIDNALKDIKRVYKKEVQLNKIPLDDPATLGLFQKGMTSGVFQFESNGIRNVLRRLEPTSIEDVAAVNALYRPGPMTNIDTFIKRKKGIEPIRYPDASLAAILENTYGIIVYQEQIMQVAAQMAGFSLGQADILRRAVSKKKKAVLDEERQHFVTGALKQGHSQAKAEEIYDYIERFANYGFNRSHAFAYSFIGFQMAYLKVHYPGPFFKALFHSVNHNSGKLKEYVHEAKNHRLQILPPDINESSRSFFLLDKKRIRFGFGGIKGLRRDFIQEILQKRSEQGRFTSIDQFLLRIDSKWLKPDYLMPLIYAGVFDSLHSNRRQLADELEGKIQNVQYSGGSLSLMDIMALKDTVSEDYPLMEKLALEEEYLGLYLSGHPTESFPKVKRLKAVSAVSELLEGQRSRVLFYIKEIREIRTKKGEKMAFLEGGDASGELSVTLFPAVYRRFVRSLAAGQVVLLYGKTERSRYNQELQLLAEEVAPAEELEKNAPPFCYLKLTEELDAADLRHELLELLKRNRGESPVVLYLEKEQRRLKLNESFKVQRTPVFQKELETLLGERNVIFR